MPDRTAVLALAASVQTFDWFDHPEQADPYARLVVYDTPGTRQQLAKLIAGPWQGRTWSYLNAMDSQTNGILAGDPLLELAVDPDVRMPYDYPNQIAMDVRKTKWRQIVAQKVKDQIALGHKGVFIDDVNLTPGLKTVQGEAYDAPGWADAMVTLVRSVKTAAGRGEVVINLPPTQAAWRGWMDWQAFESHPQISKLLKLNVIWEIERGFSDPNIKGNQANTQGLAHVLSVLKAHGRRAILHDKSGQDLPYQLRSYLDHANPGVDYLSPSVRI
jgi:hypothetical protein